MKVDGYNVSLTEFIMSGYFRFKSEKDARRSAIKRVELM